MNQEIVFQKAILIRLNNGRGVKRPFEIEKLNSTASGDQSSGTKKFKTENATIEVTNGGTPVYEPRKSMNKEIVFEKVDMKTYFPTFTHAILIRLKNGRGLKRPFETEKSNSTTSDAQSSGTKKFKSENVTEEATNRGTPLYKVMCPLSPNYVQSLNPLTQLTLKLLASLKKDNKI